MSDSKTTYKDLLKNSFRDNFTVDDLVEIIGDNFKFDHFSKFITGNEVSLDQEINGDHDFFSKFVDRNLKLIYRSIENNTTDDINNVYLLFQNYGLEEKSSIIHSLNHVLGLYNSGNEVFKKTIDIIKNLDEDNNTYDNVSKIVNYAVMITEGNASIDDLEMDIILKNEKEIITFDDEVNSFLFQNYKKGIPINNGVTDYGHLRFIVQKGNRNLSNTKYKLGIGNQIVTLNNNDKDFLLYVADNCLPEDKNDLAILGKTKAYIKKNL